MIRDSEPERLGLETLVRRLSGTQLKIVLTMGLLPQPVVTRRINLRCEISRSTTLVALEGIWRVKGWLSATRSTAGPPGVSPPPWNGSSSRCGPSRTNDKSIATDAQPVWGRVFLQAGQLAHSAGRLYHGLVRRRRADIQDYSPVFKLLRVG